MNDILTQGLRRGLRQSLRRGLATLALIFLLAGCGTTPPNNYYLLSARGAGHAPVNQSPSLGIGPIEIPEYLNRNGLVYNRDGNQLYIASYERWAEPVANGVERVISLNLAGMLDTENVQSFPWYRSEQPDYGVQVTLMSLDANDTQATLIAEWVLTRPGSRQVLSRRISRLFHDMPVGTVSAAQIAPAYSELLFQLSEIIAAKISAEARLVLVNEPTRTRNSPTNPLIPGRPMLASVASMNATVNIGMTWARPPKSLICLVCRRS